MQWREAMEVCVCVVGCVRVEEASSKCVHVFAKSTHAFKCTSQIVHAYCIRLHAMCSWVCVVLI